MWYSNVCGTGDCRLAVYYSCSILIFAGGAAKTPYGYAVDWWSLGIILYEMVVGTATFGDTESLSKFEIFNNILHKNVSFPLSMSSDLKLVLRGGVLFGLCRLICIGLLDKNQMERFSWPQLERSPFFHGVRNSDSTILLAL